MARPKREDKPVRLTVRIPEDMKTALEAGLKERDVSKSEWGEKAAERTLEEWEKEDGK